MQRDPRPDVLRAGDRRVDRADDAAGGYGMRTKNAARITDAEHQHIERVKSLACGVCGEGGPSEAHHIEQGQHFTVIPLCESCHRSSFNGWHGQRRIWKAMKLDELAVLNSTVKALVA